ncbi:MAG TPA: MBL fold metallo-hydrolase [Terriglobia bacterium]|nr:MBL fold metallo-hydrolase [Terriglobia bacterium]
MKLGHFNIYALSDGSFGLDGGQMFGVVPKPLWEKELAADARNRVKLELTCLLIQTGRHNILIETGIGDKFDAKRNDIYMVDHSAASLPDQLKKAGLGLEDIDVVINTHLHFDHCGWNARREGDALVPAFPRARYFVQRGEWEHACQPTERDQGSFVQEFFTPAEKQTEFLEGDAEIMPGIRLEVLPGHTRDMQAVRITSEGEQAYFISDLVPSTAHLAYPWMMSFDLYPLETLANKKRVLPKLAEERTLVIFPHDNATPWARLEEHEGRISPVVDPSARR